MVTLQCSGFEGSGSNGCLFPGRKREVQCNSQHFFPFVLSPCFIEIALSQAWLLSYFVRFSFLHLMQCFPWTPLVMPPEPK